MLAEWTNVNAVNSFAVFSSIQQSGAMPQLALPGRQRPRSCPADPKKFQGRRRIFAQGMLRTLEECGSCTALPLKNLRFLAFGDSSTAHDDFLTKGVDSFG
jgi:hypothetical protein